MASTFATFKARVGGKWAITWQAYFVSAPVSFIACFGSIGRFAHNGLDLFWAGLLALATTAILGLLTWFLMKARAQNRLIKPTSLWAVVLGAFCAGAIFTVGIAAGQAALGQDFLKDFGRQLIANSLLILWWAVTLTLLLDSRERFSLQRDEVINSSIELELVKMRGSQTERRMRNALNTQISRELSQARSELNAAIHPSAPKAGQESATEQTWRPVAQMIRDIASEVMRPLSRKLWESAATAFPPPNVWQVLKMIISQQPLRPLALTAVVVMLSVGTLISNFGVGPSLAVLVITIAFIWMLLPAATWMMKRFPKAHTAIFLFTVLLFQIFDTAAWIWAGELAGVEVSSGALALNIVACLVLFLLTSGYGAYDNVNQATLESFRQSLGKKQMAVLVSNKVISTLARDAARNLHGQVQTRLISCAAAIDRASQSGDVDLLDRALVEVNEIFDAATLSSGQPEPLALAEQLNAVTKPWMGICEIELQLEDELKNLDDAASVAVSSVVEEAVTNAVRHGRASAVRILVRNSDSDIEVRVTDNGAGLSAGEGAPAATGLGTELIRLVSAGRFSLSRAADGSTELRATISKTGY